MSRYVIENGVIRYCPDSTESKVVTEKPNKSKSKKA